MALLCRWITESGDKVTVKASTVKEHPFLPDHVILGSVVGISDNTYPEVRPSSLVARKEDILYLMAGPEVPVEATIPPSEVEAPSGPPPPPLPKRKS